VLNLLVTCFAMTFMSQALPSASVIWQYFLHEDLLAFVISLL
jgi:hypothetical protein